MFTPTDGMCRIAAELLIEIIKEVVNDHDPY